MTDPWVPLQSLEDLDRAVLVSMDEPVVILKHSVTCGVSAQAFDELDAWMAGPGQPPRSFIVTVQTHRAISNAIAERFGVRHESPQLLVLRGGAVQWHASHFRVTPTAVERALAS